MRREWVVEVTTSQGTSSDSFDSEREANQMAENVIAVVKGPLAIRIYHNGNLWSDYKSEILSDD